MADQLIHPLVRTSSRLARATGPSAAAIVALLVALLALTTLLPGRGHLGADLQAQPLRPPAGLGL